MLSCPTASGCCTSPPASGMATSALADPPTAGRLGWTVSSAPGSECLRLAGSGGGFGKGPSSVTIVAWGGLGPRRPGPPVSVR
eukprot:5388806-Alexandrium_andersonii.AAC.1